MTSDAGSPDPSKSVIQYEDLFQAHILPISKFRRIGEGEYQPIAAVGSGFTFGEHTLVTCWHCVRGPLSEGEVFAVAARSGGIESQTYDQVFELADLEQDGNGSDLALARIDFSIELVLNLATGPPTWGEDVVACGYPMPLSTKDAKTRQPLINTHASVFGGKVTRVRLSDWPGQPETKVYELDMLAPPGLSGSPLLLPQSKEVVGVVVREQGYEIPNEDRMITFAYAIHLSVLASAKGKATDSRPLGEFLVRKR